MIVVVSDIHLGIEHIEGLAHPDRDEFKHFLEEISRKENSNIDLFSDVTDLVLNGDIEDQWRRNIRTITRENYDIYNLLKEIRESDIDIHYIRGNHDWYAKRDRTGIISQYVDSYYDTEYREECILVEDQTTYKFMHGYQFDNSQKMSTFTPLCLADGDVYGDAMDDARHLWDRIREETDLSKRKFREIIRNQDVQESDKNLRVAPDKAIRKLKDNPGIDWLCIGHTHKSGIRDINHNPVEPSQTDRGVVNSGSWIAASTFLTLDDYPRIWEWNHGDIREHAYGSGS